MFDLTVRMPYHVPMAPKISQRQREILVFIEQQMRDRGFPPSVREIGDAVGLTSPSTVHSHLNTLQRHGYLRRDPSKPRAIEVRYDSNSGAMMDKRPVRHVPLIGDVASGTNVLAAENVEELLPVPVDFAGDAQRVARQSGSVAAHHRDNLAVQFDLIGGEYHWLHGGVMRGQRDFVTRTGVGLDGGLATRDPGDDDVAVGWVIDLGGNDVVAIEDADAGH